MLTFTKLRLSGFKSFVDGTDVVIDHGLTGVVGPNGCGKSNLVEALRWVMGETSAKQMRGGEMDDVIFGGTAGRPARNVAEVLIDLDNANRTAAPPFESFDQLQVGGDAAESFSEVPVGTRRRRGRLRHGAGS